MRHHGVRAARVALLRDAESGRRPDRGRRRPQAVARTRRVARHRGAPLGSPPGPVLHSHAMGKLSIVIPTLNAAAELRRSLPPLAEFAALGLIGEVILADGGSTDETGAIAEAAGARLVVAEAGRGTQLGAGARAARHDWLLFLHADTILAAGWDEAVRDFMARADCADRAAYFHLRLDDERFGARRIAWLANVRSRLLGLPYGDQGLLIGRSLYRRIGGFRPLPLMEDVDLVRRIGRGRLVALAPAAMTSAARYRRDGFWLRPARNQLCLIMWLLGIPVGTIARIYGR